MDECAGPMALLVESGGAGLDAQSSSGQLSPCFCATDGAHRFRTRDPYGSQLMFGVRRMSLVVLLALVLAGGDAVGARAALAPGIDVSHWQGTIDWLGVAGGGHRFVFAKATEGATIVDATYPFNRTGAAGTGLRVGAYHFARPTGSGDAAIVASAVSQADHFVDFAQPAAGDLPPVLDLEASGGLSATDLATWTQAWLDDVE